MWNYDKKIHKIYLKFVYIKNNTYICTVINNKR